MRALPRLWPGGTPTRRSRAPLGAPLVMVALLSLGPAPIPSLAADSEKRVENRSQTGDSTARPVSSKPGESPGPSTPPTDPGNEPGKPDRNDGDRHATPEITQNVEVTQVIESHTTVVVEAPSVSAAPEYSVLEEVVYHTLGRQKAAEVIACSDPRNPLPSYAFAGIRPSLSLEAPHDTLRLQSFQLELQASPGWNPSESILTLVAGAATFHLPLPPSGGTTTLFPRDATGRTFLTQLSLAAAGDRLRLSVDFSEASLGRAPVLRPGDDLLVSIDPTLDAPPAYTPPRLVLVPGDGRTPSALRLVGKSGSPGAVLPELTDLELAASCKILHLIAR